MKHFTSYARATSVAVAGLLMFTAATAQHQGHDMPGMKNPGAAAPPHQPQPRSSQAQPATPSASPGRANPDTPRPARNTSGPHSMPVDDNMITYQVLIDQLEYTRSRGGGDGLAWEAQGWVGRDYNRLWFKTEGARQGGKTEEGRLDLLWSRPVAAFWDLQAGVRRDFGEGAKRNWLALGVQGVAPYWFDVEATAYLGNSGRTALRLAAEYQFVLTQRTILTPEIEANLYGKSDLARGVGSGLSDLTVGLRLRHEIRRELAPYIGVSWGRRFGETADLARAAGSGATERQFVAGVRTWF